ncbi:MAG: beta-glucosidase [Phycisphaerales bacterium]|nr:beta-glucosidase [Phycisphaerales bacterium]
MTAPNTFLWGAATSAFQIEGAAHTGGKGPSIWDDFCRSPGRTAPDADGAITCDHVNRYREDVALMQELNLDAYRFSISWPRVLPTGRGYVNSEGLDFYDKLVDALCDAGIVPCVTLYHWDLPSALQIELGGWENESLPQLFADYATIMYDRLGDRVRYWITLNEPWCSVDGGYFAGVHAPGIRDRARGYLAGHNLMRAHGMAVAAYRASRNNQGAISLALNSSYYFPATDSREDEAAAERGMLDFAGWFGDPIYFGDYPPEMREAYGDLLPAFSDEDARLLQKSIDFLSINYYTSELARHDASVGGMRYRREQFTDRPRTSTNWAIVPEGFRELLVWLDRRYGGLPMYVTENGIALPDHADDAGYVDDPDRVAYLRDHFAAARSAMDAGVNLCGYFVWSLLDNLEWAEGFSKRFGLIRCDFETLTRTIKASGRWYADWIARGGWADNGHGAVLDSSAAGGER